MDLNKKHLLYLIVFFLFLSLNAFGQSNNITGRILDQSTKEPVEYANVTLFRQDSVFIEGTVSDTIGRFGFTNLISDDYVLLISYMGFETKKILLQNFLESVEIDVFLSERMLSLDEIVISASSTISKINQRIVFPTKLQLDHSANGMQLLNTMMLSGLNINPMTNTISSSDGGKVVLQINGVNTTSEEILTLQPRQIRRIEYSDYAGIRYGEASKIVNYIVTRDDKGGIIGMDLMNSLNILAGGDVFFAKFNKGKSEYALNYTTAFQKINSNNRTRTGSYRFRNSIPLQRDEIGDGGDYSYQMHDVTFGYNYQKNDSTFFNAKLKYALTDHPHNDFKSNLKENSIEIGQILDGVSQKINTPTMDLYYEHGLKNQQKIYVNIVGSYIKAETDRNYIEYNDIDTIFREQFGLTSDKYSLIAEGIYEKSFTYGSLKFGVKHVQSFTKQEIQQNGVFQSDLKQSESSIFSEWLHSKNNFSYSFGLRINRVHFSNTSTNKSYYNLLPKVMLGYRLNENSFIRYDVEMTQTNPTLAELTNTEIRIDPYLAEKGNLSLKPYNNLNNNLFYENKKGLFTFNANLRHHHKHNPIMESLKEQGDVFLIMSENMKSWNKYNAEMTLKVGMIKNILQFSFTGGYSHFNSQGKNFSFGIGAFNPFRNVSRTIIENKNNQSPFRRESFSSASQTIVATLTWNFSFGKTHNSSSKSIENKDTDYGIKSSYK